MPDQNASNNPLQASPSRRENENDTGTVADEHALPSPGGAPNGRLAALAATAKNYARAARAANTQRAYDSDWRQFSSWLRRQGFAHCPPDPQTVGLYLAACAEGRNGSDDADERRHAGATAVRDLLALSAAWRATRHAGPPYIATVLAGIRRRTAGLPCRRRRSSPTICSPCWRLSRMDLRGLRDRAILAIGFAGGLRRSEIVGLDCGPNQSEDGTGWIEILVALRRPKPQKTTTRTAPALPMKAACC